MHEPHRPRPSASSSPPGPSARAAPAALLQTVAGELSAALVDGPVLSHEHLAVDLSRDSDTAAVLGCDHRAHVAAELAELHSTYGLSLVVELTCRGMGRDAPALSEISERSGVAVIAATGWYYEPFHPQDVAALSESQLVDLLVRDIQEGIDSTDVLPGVVGEVGSHGDEPSSAETRTLAAAARAAAATGLSVATHAQFGRGGLAQLELLTKADLPPHRISIGHQDLLDDPSVHRALAATGAYVSFDTVGKHGYQSDETRLRLLLALLEAGHADRVLLSCDVSRSGYLRSEGGPGYGHLFRSFLPQVRAAGADDDLIDLLTRRNPLRFLAGEDSPADRTDREEL